MARSDPDGLRTVALQLRTLAADSDNQPIIARDEGCLSALIKFVSGSNPEIQDIALDALGYLTSNPENKEVLKQENSLIEALKACIAAENGRKQQLLQDSQASSTNTIPSAGAGASAAIIDRKKKALQVLEPLLKTEDDQEDQIIENPELLRFQRLVGVLEEKEIKKPLDESHIQVTSHAITHCVHVPKLSDETFRLQLERNLVRRKGVISVSLEPGPEIVQVFCRLHPDSLVQTINEINNRNDAAFIPPVTEHHNTQMYGDSLSTEQRDSETHKDGVDQENYKGGEYDSNNNNDHNNNNRPQYISKGENSATNKRTTVMKGSLAERLKEQKMMENKQKSRAERLMGRFTKGFSFW